MADLFKNIYNPSFINKFTSVISILDKRFNIEKFTQSIFCKDWEEKELKQRMRHITICLKNHLTGSFKEQLDLITSSIPLLIKNGFKPDNLEFIFYPDFVELYGIEDLEESINAFEKITQFVSCEFGVRPFIIKYENKMIAQMFKWSNHEHYSVRRLASEGSRPRLPWGMALQSLKKDPASILPILENLKNDKNEIVRRSVANNLNDIAKDHPELVFQISKKWIGQSKDTDKLIKHACRTLLKNGHSETMLLFGFANPKEIQISNFKVLTPQVQIGDSLAFQFNLYNNSKKEELLRLEYGLYYLKANGTLSRKVFKISEKIYQKKTIFSIERKQSFKLITTRKFHIGRHELSIIINGHELHKLPFELT